MTKRSNNVKLTKAHILLPANGPIFNKAIYSVKKSSYRCEICLNSLETKEVDSFH